ncbi:MAG: riboflavin synthase [Planctomycetaceae bacterium]|nr:riboflavin synthase [Planctomycetaceae bacterium]
MFTGLVEGRARVVGLTPEPPGVLLMIDPPAGMLKTSDRDVPRIGDSVAINGCCLTIVALSRGTWAFQAGEETLSRTNLGGLRPGDAVNIERSLPADGRIGGHFVQGHVDDVGTVNAIDRSGEWITMWFRVPSRLTRQMVSKGSITVDGISLTLVDVEADRFSVALIPHTLEVTTLGLRQPGDQVNIETDILGKYMEKLLAGDGQRR